MFEKCQQRTHFAMCPATLAERMAMRATEINASSLSCPRERSPKADRHVSSLATGFERWSAPLYTSAKPSYRKLKRLTAVRSSKRSPWLQISDVGLWAGSHWQDATIDSV